MAGVGHSGCSATTATRTISSPPPRESVGASVAARARRPFEGRSRPEAVSAAFVDTYGMQRRVRYGMDKNKRTIRERPFHQSHARTVSCPMTRMTMIAT